MTPFDPMERLMARRSVKVSVSIDTGDAEPLEFEAELREPALLEQMPLIAQQQRMNQQEFGLRSLGIYLWISGKRVTYEQLAAMGNSTAEQLAIQLTPHLTKLLNRDEPAEETAKSQKKRKAHPTGNDGVQPSA